MSGQKTIEEFHHRHKGEEVAILLNGPSLLENLDYLPEHTIGVNASGKYHYSDYHVALDYTTLVKMCDPDTYPTRPKYCFSHPLRYIDGREHKRPIHSVGWSDDPLGRGFYTGRVSLWVALQLASYMGFDPIYLVGFDLYGGHFPGHINEGEPMMEQSARKQLYLMNRVKNYYQPRGIITERIYNCNPDSLCKSLPYFNLKER
jgi:hypothetical protein